MLPASGLPACWTPMGTWHTPPIHFPTSSFRPNLLPPTTPSRSIHFVWLMPAHNRNGAILPDSGGCHHGCHSARCQSSHRIAVDHGGISPDRCTPRRILARRSVRFVPLLESSRPPRIYGLESWRNDYPFAIPAMKSISFPPRSTAFSIALPIILPITTTFWQMSPTNCDPRSLPSAVRPRLL